ncbi:hypothetical protein DID73_00835 [Candidatus Marinamargulisbacteria bacterium SCGC AG-343-K17]|nr:hypothetical protein DID73_00835 [Candidatus Marinamargulisbacteria bacterium SCGC AG-343-K17]
MQITKNHLFNILLWVVIILFMAYKSIQHTISIHDQGVSVAIHEYQIQAQARVNHVLNTSNVQGVQGVSLTYTIEFVNRIKNTMDPYEYIQLNDQLTEYIDLKTIDSLQYSTDDSAILAELQRNIKQESLIFYSHAQSFNRLIQRFPYVLLSNNYPLISLGPVPSANGVIVER